MADEAERSLSITSAGYELYLPPAPFSMPPEPARFVMLDDQNDHFFDVDYSAPDLRNTSTWTDLRVCEVCDPAIVFPPKQWSFFEKDHSIRITGFLVAIHSRENDLFTAVRLGTVHVQLFQERYMNWGALASLKGSEIVQEMKGGLIRHLFNRRNGEAIEQFSYVTAGSVLDSMPRRWHLYGDVLNYELDSRFTGARRISKDQRWKLYATASDMAGRSE